MYFEGQRSLKSDVTSRGRYSLTQYARDDQAILELCKPFDQIENQQR